VKRNYFNISRFFREERIGIGPDKNRDAKEDSSGALISQK
jgi:hypothetical protein